MIDPPGAGAWNMAVDEVLLLDAAENGIASLRFYEWNTPTLSLGYFQNYEDRQRHPSSLAVTCVRRQTGGGAIVHDRELTYSLALPASHPLARQTEELYSSVHDSFIKSIESILGDKLKGWVLRRRDQESGIAARDEPFLCFERRARGDVVLEYQAEAGATSARAAPDERKILGSAQRRHRGAVLQHGSLILNGSPAAPEVVGLCDLCQGRFSAADVSHAAGPRIMAVLQHSPIPTQLPPEMQSRAYQLANTKYGTARWTKRR